MVPANARKTVSARLYDILGGPNKSVKSGVLLYVISRNWES